MKKIYCQKFFTIKKLLFTIKKKKKITVKEIFTVKIFLIIII